MADIVSRQKRSEMMAGIRGKNTRPELFIRKSLHVLGYRYRLHVKELPGKPDLVLKKYNGVIFIHGCFWHGHDCHLFKWPQTRPEFWHEKINSNRNNDMMALKKLNSENWRVLVIWECATRGKEKIDSKYFTEIITQWLESGNDYHEIKGGKQ